MSSKCPHIINIPSQSLVIMICSQYVQPRHVDGVYKVHCAYNGTQYFPSLEVWGEAAAKGFVSRPLRRGGLHCYVSHPTEGGDSAAI